MSVGYNAELEKTSLQEWIKKRANAVRAAFTTFSCMNEFGHGDMLSDESTPTQIACGNLTDTSLQNSMNLSCFKSRLS